MSVQLKKNTQKLKENNKIKQTSINQKEEQNVPPADIKLDDTNQNKELIDSIKYVYRNTDRIDDYGDWSEYLDEDGVVILRVESDGEHINLDFGGEYQYQSDLDKVDQEAFANQED